MVSAIKKLVIVKQKKLVIPTTLRSEFQSYFANRRTVADGLEHLLTKYLTQTMPDWEAIRRNSRIQTHLKPFWLELWTIASGSMTEEEFHREQMGLLRSIEFDIGLYYAKHRCLNNARFRSIVEQCGATPDRRHQREAAAARIIRKFNQERSDNRREAMRDARNGERSASRDARTAEAEARRIRGVLQMLVKSGKVAPADIPVIDGRADEILPVLNTAVQDPVLAALVATLGKFPLNPNGDREAFIRVFTSLADFFEHPDFKDRFGATQYRDYWFSAYRSFVEGIQAHNKRAAMANA